MSWLSLTRSPDVDLRGCVVGLGTLTVTMAFADCGLDDGQVLVEAAGGDQPDQHLDLLVLDPGRVWSGGGTLPMILTGRVRCGDQSERGGSLSRCGMWPAGGSAMAGALQAGAGR